MVTLTDEEAAKAFALEKLQVASREKNRVTVNVRQDMQTFIQAMGRHPVTNIDMAEQSLEDIFLHYYGGNEK
jgi:ABC-2 type transport system ATP-binding protein